MGEGAGPLRAVHRAVHRAACHAIGWSGRVLRSADRTQEPVGVTSSGGRPTLPCATYPKVEPCETTISSACRGRRGAVSVAMGGGRGADELRRRSSCQSSSSRSR